MFPLHSICQKNQSTKTTTLPLQSPQYAGVQVLPPAVCFVYYNTEVYILNYAFYVYSAEVLICCVIHWKQKAWQLISGPVHPLFTEFIKLPSGRRYRAAAASKKHNILFQSKCKNVAKFKYYSHWNHVCYYCLYCACCVMYYCMYDLLCVITNLWSQGQKFHICEQSRSLLMYIIESFQAQLISFKKNN